MALFAQAPFQADVTAHKPTTIIEDDLGSEEKHIDQLGQIETMIVIEPPRVLFAKVATQGC
jgi:hypothetical protein